MTIDYRTYVLCDAPDCEAEHELGGPHPTPLGWYSRGKLSWCPTHADAQRAADERRAARRKVKIVETPQV